MNHWHRMLGVVAILLATCSLASTEASLLEKTQFGVSYDIAILPAVSRFVGPTTLALPQFHRGSLEISYPYFRYFSLGVSIDYTLAISDRVGDPLLDFSKASKKITSTFLGVTAHLRPQLPFSIKDVDIILYTEGQLGFGTSSPIAFGTQPLSDYTFQGTEYMPTPFPIMLETTPKVGVQIFGWKFFGVDVGFGYRIFWVVHPMVKVPEKDRKEGMPKGSSNGVWYDVSSFFVQTGLRFAF